MPRGVYPRKPTTSAGKDRLIHELEVRLANTQRALDACVAGKQQLLEQVNRLTEELTSTDEQLRKAVDDFEEKEIEIKEELANAERFFEHYRRAADWRKLPCHVAREWLNKDAIERPDIYSESGDSV